VSGAEYYEPDAKLLSVERGGIRDQHRAESEEHGDIRGRNESPSVEHGSVRAFHSENTAGLPHLSRVCLEARTPARSRWPTAHSAARFFPRRTRLPWPLEAE
jgi:hypothetical protein